jgi:AraC-like DNA-binding protein
MKNIIISAERENADLKPIFVGEEKCAPEHSFGPYIRAHTIIHAVLSGKGKLRDKYGEHDIGAGKLFIINRGEETVYTADKREPWHYVWIAFIGEGERLYETERSVFDAPSAIVRELYELICESTASADAYTAILYSLTHKLFSGNDGERDRISEIKRYIEYNYMNSINVETIAKEFGYERSSLYRSFVSRYGIGVKAYLCELRMTKAKEFLSLGKTVSETAYLVGFRDEFAFSRAFKKRIGEPPSKYKAN